MTLYYISCSQTPINTMKQRKKDGHWLGAIFKLILEWKLLYSDEIFADIMYVLNGPIDIKPVLVQKMAWRRTGDKSLFEPMMAKFTGAHMRHWASMSSWAREESTLYHLHDTGRTECCWHVVINKFKSYRQYDNDRYNITVNESWIKHAGGIQFN